MRVFAFRAPLMPANTCVVAIRLNTRDIRVIAKVNKCQNINAAFDSLLPIPSILKQSCSIRVYSKVEFLNPPFLSCLTFRIFYAKRQTEPEYCLDFVSLILIPRQPVNCRQQI